MKIFITEQQIKRVPVDSSNIQEIGYDKSTRTMEIKFKNGRIYRYRPITLEGYNSFLRSKSKGEFFHKNIKNNKAINSKKI